MVVKVVESFVPSINQYIETGTQEIMVKIVELLSDSFLNFEICSEIAICQALLQLSEEMKIIWCEIWAVRRIFQNIPPETLFQITYNRGYMCSVVVVQQGTFREYSRSFPAKFLAQPVHRGKITDSIHVP
ncbi:hypothetical protein AVEN_228137-1 [Araneus ventricosus]|uniref:Uncharacterized protein n=1 Tax=Araneus ventricosus TaxID=182803 RepID=A0A4Y2CT39_ARAVE|nr:hypothetical protein AVEN_228137-1 [Araneus ventricosus]